MNYLYVCHFSNGHIKVGRSIDPTSRIAAHAERVSCVGIELVEHEFFECRSHVAPAEGALIARCAAKAVITHKREWFSGLFFPDVADWARQIANEQFDVPVSRAGISGWLEAEKGRTASLAAHFSRTPSAISQWKQNGVPLDLMKEIRDLTNGLVTLEDMVPDAALKPITLGEGA